MLSFPNSFRTALMVFSESFSRVTSARNTNVRFAGKPSLIQSFLVFSREFKSRTTRATEAPFFAKRTAIARPIPLLAPLYRPFYYILVKQLIMICKTRMDSIAKCY